MKRTVLSAVIGIMVILACSGSAQPAANQDEQALLSLVKEVQTQQTEIAANQAKIEAKLTEVAEAIRVARIFAGRER